ncbi:hypothetical protein ANCCAN_27052 [Ancylostoma caninum]|uniref:Uncharacterized protein n=1 Tax=Ancylostoma caninum TaxID=29170 RepID=A0A368F8L3_ANCCA|nr:hypothetical protein ANCCAN_27052 [Ancylostoma caninum]
MRSSLEIHLSLPEVTSPSESETSTFSITPIRRVSPIAPLFPAGGVDVTLNSKSVAIVRTDHARDRFKQALQLRAGAAALITAENISQSGSVPVEIHQKPNQERPVLVTASLKSGPHASNLVMKQVKGFVKQTPNSKNIHDGLRESPSSTKSSAEVRLSTTVPTEQPRLEETTRSTQQTRLDGSNDSLKPLVAEQKQWAKKDPELLDDVKEEVVVTSDPLVVRLPHENFVTGCPRSVQC